MAKSMWGQITFLPCNPLLSKKLLRLNSVFLEAKYWTKRCRGEKKGLNTRWLIVTLLTDNTLTIRPYAVVIHARLNYDCDRLIRAHSAHWVGWAIQPPCNTEGAHLVAINHEVVCGDKRLENHHPAGVGGPLKQRVSQLGNVHVHLIGAVDQIWRERENNQRQRASW